MSRFPFLSALAGLALLPAVAVILTCLSAPDLHAQEVEEGERLFRQRCASCHTTQEGQNRVGPHLASLEGRAAGSVQGARYSAPLRSSGLVWDAASLDRFLANPRQTVPGTSMTAGLPNEAQRRAVIGFLLRMGG
jgi:cytochrome c